MGLGGDELHPRRRTRAADRQGAGVGPRGPWAGEEAAGLRGRRRHVPVFPTSVPCSRATTSRSTEHSGQNHEPARAPSRAPLSPRVDSLPNDLGALPEERTSAWPWPAVHRGLPALPRHRPLRGPGRGKQRVAQRSCPAGARGIRGRRGPPHRCRARPRTRRPTTPGRSVQSQEMGGELGSHFWSL